MDFPLGEYAEESVQKRAERREDAGDMPAGRQTTREPERKRCAHYF
jgi:hypothetical protein